MWECLCECGTVCVVSGKDIRSGHKKSCGCIKRQVNPAAKAAATTHGLRNSPEYGVWRAMKKRCYVPSSPMYARYGGRGIQVCQEWLESFQAFYRDMGQRPSSKHSLNRVDNDGHYSKSNCEWATAVEQANNRCSSRKVMFDGELLSYTELDRKLGAAYKTSAHYYLGERGMDPSDYAVMLKQNREENTSC